MKQTKKDIARHTGNRPGDPPTGKKTVQPASATTTIRYHAGNGDTSLENGRGPAPKPVKAKKHLMY